MENCLLLTGKSIRKTSFDLVNMIQYLSKKEGTKNAKENKQAIYDIICNRNYNNGMLPLFWRNI